MRRRRVIDRQSVSATLRYADARLDASRAQLDRLPAWRWWMAPVCWCRGHRWPQGAPVLLFGALQHCLRCGEELDGRVP